MAVYGWRVYNAAGALLYDDSVIMSRWLGSYTIPLQASSTGLPPSGWSKLGLATYRYVISNIPFNGGVPFAYVLPTPGLALPQGTFAYNHPDIVCGANSITLTYTERGLMYPDDTTAGYIGGMTIHYGVYTSNT